MGGGDDKSQSNALKNSCKNDSKDSEFRLFLTSPSIATTPFMRSGTGQSKGGYKAPGVLA
jgi:hypothetical protein